MKYIKPSIKSITEAELSEIIQVSATCRNALCQAGSTYTCGTTTSYSCQNWSGNDPINCPATMSFSCPKTAAHTDKYDGETM